jgi:hypothetical protein
MTMLELCVRMILRVGHAVRARAEDRREFRLRWLKTSSLVMIARLMALCNHALATRIVQAALWEL